MKFLGASLLTDDVARLRAFYTKVLCCQTSGDDIHTELLVEGGGLVLYSREASRRDMGFSYLPNAGAGYVALSFRVEDVDAEYERLLTTDVDFVTRPRTYPWGARSFHFRDPDGNLITMVRPPA